jgi:hypothetical protein
MFSSPCRWENEMVNLFVFVSRWLDELRARCSALVRMARENSDSQAHLKEIVVPSFQNSKRTVFQSNTPLSINWDISWGFGCSSNEMLVKCNGSIKGCPLTKSCRPE